MNYKTLAKITALLILAVPCLVAQPEPGDVYREYALVPTDLPNYDLYWRVTDPNATAAGAQEFLPNKEMTINVADLDGAIRAEIVIDRWGGHAGTYGKKLRLNSNDWVYVPDRELTKETAAAYCYLYQDNPIVDIPLEQVVEGKNTIQGSCEGQSCFGFGWGQWGWYGIRLRIYYDSSKPHPTGEITSPRTGDTLEEYPTITVSAQSETSTIKSVNVIGYYEGMDVDGDGIYQEWQRRYSYAKLDNIIGTDTEAPYELQWNTRHVPDQQPGEVKFLARIQDEAGYWSVTEIVDSITLHRDTVSVQMYKPRFVPQDFGVRNGQTRSAYTDIDSSNSFYQASEAFVHLRTWNGVGEYFWLNDNKKSINGLNHRFDYQARDVSSEWLKYGANQIKFSSNTEAHGVEILWPGPVITVRYNLNAPAGSLCDINGSGTADLDDLIEFVLLSRREPTDPRLDWDSDGRYTIADVIALLLDINNGTCPPAEGAASLSSVRRTFEINWEELDYLKETLDKIDLENTERSYLEGRLEELSQSIELPRVVGLSLQQNFPNPFNPSTSISFTVGSGGAEVSLNIYDIRGSLVRTLVDGFRDEGAYTSYWDGTDSNGRDRSSGVYIYRLQTREKSLTRKMVLLK